jgi:ABC-type glycerol-3-phosphate transport system permease component
MKITLTWLVVIICLFSIIEAYSHITQFDLKGEYFVMCVWIMIISGIVTIIGTLIEYANKNDKDDKS